MERELHQLNQMVAKVKAFTKAMAESNAKWDAYVDQEQDKFQLCLNRQRSEINGLKEWLEWVELRTLLLELANESMSERMDDMATKLCFCSRTEGAQVRVTTWLKFPANRHLFDRQLVPIQWLTCRTTSRCMRRTIRHLLWVNQIQRL